MRKPRKSIIERNEKLTRNLEYFNNIIVPWCEENNYSLHNAFENSRNTDEEKYNVLSELWKYPIGKEYLRSFFRQRGWVLKKKD